MQTSKSLFKHFINRKDGTNTQTDKQNFSIEDGGQIGGQILTNSQNKILEFIRENCRITREELSNKLKINSSAIQKHLNNFKKNGIIKRIGKTRGYWKICNIK